MSLGSTNSRKVQSLPLISSSEKGFDIGARDSVLDLLLRSLDFGFFAGELTELDILYPVKVVGSFYFPH